MKKLIVLLLSVSLILCCAGCFSDDSTGGNTDGDTPSETKSTIAANDESEKKDLEISVVSTRIGKDFEDKPILLVEYEFINHTEEANSFTFLCQDTAFQNGVECSNTVISDDVDSEQQLNEVKPETPYKLTVGYKLQDTTTDVEIEITDLLGNETYLTQTVSLSQ